MNKNEVMIITGSSKGIGRNLVEYYVKKGIKVIGCSRQAVGYELENYQHFCLDVSDEKAVTFIQKLFAGEGIGSRTCNKTCSRPD